MDFQFAPWERLTDAVADGAADARVEVKGRVWLYRQCGPIPWVRPLDKKSGEWNYLLSAVVQTLSSMVVVPPMEFDAGELSQFLAPENRAFSLGRVWKLSEDAFALWDPQSLWRLYRNPDDFASNRGAIPFGLSRRVGVAGAQSSTVFQRLQSDWRAPRSDLSVAARYILLSPQQRQLCAIETQTGTPQEFAHLVKITLQATAAWQAKADEITVYFRAEGLRANYFRLRAQSDIGIRERAILGHLTRAFAPHLDKRKKVLPAALQWQADVLQVSAAKPSRHEQMEAALELRAWLQTHWPDGVKHLSKIV